MAMKKKKKKKNRKNKKRKRSITNINSQLPSEIIQLIFTKLPFFYLPSCRQICKAWNNLILSSKFITPFSNNLYFADTSPSHSLHSFYLDSQCIDIVASFTFPSDFSHIEIVGSCNGLLCFVVGNSSSSSRKIPCLSRVVDSSVRILNPMTNEYVALPGGEEGLCYYYGFGFSPKTKQYKVTRQSCVVSNLATLVEVFRLGNDKWSDGDALVVPICHNCRGVYFDGAIYWFGIDRKGRKDSVWRFDVEDEKFRKLSFPPMEEQNNDRCWFALEVFDHHLYLSFYQLSKFAYDIWKMEQGDCSFTWRWSRAFVISLLPTFDSSMYFESFQFRLVKAYENGKMLCLRGVNLILYDPENGRMEPVEPSCKVKRILWDFHIDSFSFDSLSTILAGEA